MRVHFDNVDMSSMSGPNTFAKRLAMSLSELGHSIELVDGSNCDVSIVFIEPSGRPLAKKIIQRLDGIWFSPKEFDIKNIAIKKLYEKADGIIWQSEFDRQMTTKWWGRPKSGAVIHNGIDVSKFKSIQIDALDQLRRKYEMIFVCSANWHSQKRLFENVEFFKYIGRFYESSALIVMGSNPTPISHPHIFYTGSQPYEVCLKIFSMADWMLHLAWLDHCPNTVIECLSQKTPVVCSEHGGTKELVKNFGVVLKENSEYNFELVDYTNPPRLNVAQVDELPVKNQLNYDVDVTMTTCLKKYLNYIGEII